MDDGNEIMNSTQISIVESNPMLILVSTPTPSINQSMRHMRKY